MSKLGVVLVVLGIVAVLVGLFPGLAGEKAPAPGFGRQQQIAVAIGAVLAVVGLVLACKCCKKSCCAAKTVKPDADNKDAGAGPTTG